MSTLQVATFYLEDTLWGIDVLQIREVIQGPRYSSVPQAPPQVRGLMNLRGQIVSILDLARSLGHDGEGRARETCIILKTDAEMADGAAPTQDLEPTGRDPVGLLVESMGDVVEVEEDSLDVSPANTGEHEGRFVRGVAKLEDELLLLLALTPVLEEAGGS